MFPEHLPVYFHYADELHFYWTDDFSKGSVKAATFDKVRRLLIEDRTAYKNFVRQYEQARHDNKTLAPFSSLISGEKTS